MSSSTTDSKLSGIVNFNQYFMISATYSGDIHVKSVNYEFMYGGQKACRNNSEFGCGQPSCTDCKSQLAKPITDYPGNMQCYKDCPKDLRGNKCDDPPADGCKGVTELNNSPQTEHLQCCASYGDSCPSNSVNLWQSIYGWCDGTRNVLKLMNWDTCYNMVKNYCVEYDLTKTLTIGKNGTVSNINELLPEAPHDNLDILFSGQEGEYTKNGQWPVSSDSINQDNREFKPDFNKEGWNIPIQEPQHYPVYVKNITYGPIDDNNNPLLGPTLNLITIPTHGAIIQDFIESLINSEGESLSLLHTSIDYACLWLYTYGQIYTWYNDLFGIPTNNISGLNFLNPTRDFLKCIRDNNFFHDTPGLPNVFSYANDTNSDVRKGLDQMLDQWLEAPVPSYDSGEKKFQLTFKIPWEILYTISESGTKWQDHIVDLANSLMNTLLQETQGKLQIGGKETIPIPPAFSNVVFPTLKLLYYDWKDGNCSGCWKERTPDQTQYFQCSLCQFKVNVEVWSPMLLLYFSSVFEKNYLTDDQITSFIQMLLQNNFPIPIHFFSFVKQNRPIMNQLCNIEYILPPRFRMHHVYSGVEPASLDVSKKLIMSSSEYCSCINNGLVPSSVPGEFEAGICFSRTCKQADRDIFKISNPECEQYCDDMSRWVTNKPPNPQSLRPENLDASQFSKICGKNFKPYESETINNKVLRYMLLLSVLITVIVFLILRRNKLHFILVASITLIIGTGLVGGTIYLAKDLAGTSRCITDPKTNAPKDSGCFSKITKKRINDNFCKYKQACECYLNDSSGISDACGGNCTCINTMCIANDGSPRKTSTVKTQEPKILESVYIVVLVIVLIILYLTLNSTYKYSSNSTVNAIAIYYVIILTTLVIAYINSYETDEIISEKNCGPLPSPP